MSAKSQPPANTVQFNVRLPTELKARLENYAQLVGRPRPASRAMPWPIISTGARRRSKP
ncbi:MAG: hypothetical protein ACK4R8_06455 [Thiobacillus sp.]